MKPFILISLITLLLLTCMYKPTDASPSTRIKKQGWSWDDDEAVVTTDTPVPITYKTTTAEISTKKTKKTRKPTTTRKPSTTRKPTTTSKSTTQADEFAVCLKRCPSTAEYNPVCASNRQTYQNIGQMNCAKSCGIKDLERIFNGKCS